MKKTIIFTTILAIATAFVLASCGGPKVSKDLKEIVGPFDGAEYLTDANFFRANASGINPDKEMARTIANMNTSTLLAGQIEKRVQDVVERYQQQYTAQTP